MDEGVRDDGRVDERGEGTGKEEDGRRKRNEKDK